MLFLLCFYAAFLIVAIFFTVTKNWFRARLALVIASTGLNCIILADRAAPAAGEIDLSGLDNPALAVALPLIGLGLMVLFVTRWRWLFWLVLALNTLAGGGVFYLAWRVA